MLSGSWVYQISIDCPDSITCILQQWTHPITAPALFAQLRTTTVKMCIDQGQCWGHPQLPACLASGSSPALDAPWHTWPLWHVYALLLLITLNHTQNISRLSLVCAKACHMWPFLYLHEHFMLFTRVLSMQKLVSSAQEPSGEFLKGTDFPPRMSINTLNRQTGLATTFHLRKS